MKTRLCRRDDLIVLCLKHSFNLAHTTQQAIRHARAHGVTSDVAVDAPLDRLVVATADQDQWVASLAAVGLRVVHMDAPSDSAYGDVDIVSCPCEEGKVYWIDRTPDEAWSTEVAALRGEIEDKSKALAAYEAEVDRLRGVIEGMMPASAERTKVVVTKRSHDWHAAIDGTGGTRWAAGRTTYEAIGDLVVHHGDGLGVAVEINAAPSPDQTPERTPATVLRAMILAYGAAWFERVQACVEGKADPFWDRRAEWLERAGRQLRWEYVAALRREELFLTGTELLPDYKSRLDGSTPLGAPPPEVP